LKTNENVRKGNNTKNQELDERVAGNETAAKGNTTSQPKPGTPG